MAVTSETFFPLPLYYKDEGPLIVETITIDTDLETGKRRVYGLYRNPKALEPGQPRRKRFAGTSVIQRTHMKGWREAHIEVV